MTDALPRSVSGNNENYVFEGPVYIHGFENQGSWSQIQQSPQALRLRWNNGGVQYSVNADGDSWTNVGYQKIVAQYEIVYSGNTIDNTDISVVLGDWPYPAGTDATNKQMQIVIYNSETNTTDYDSGWMYYDNNSKGDYGKIKFNCDESRYEVSNVTIKKSTGRYRVLIGIVWNPYVTVDNNAEEPVSVTFGQDTYEKYQITATIRAKEFTVHYDSNGGEGAVPTDQKIKAINGNTVTVASTPQPTREGYIFGGWQYDGTTYFGGETFEMPPENVTFIANWIPASAVINYRVNDSSMGYVSRTYERIGDYTGDVKGSLATPNTGYRFVKWINEQGKTVSEEAFYQPDKAAATYTAVFEVNQYTIATSVENGTITKSTKVNYNGSTTITYQANDGYKLKSVKVDGIDVTQSYPNSYIFNKVQADHSIAVVYERDTSVFKGALTGYEGTYDGQSHSVTFDDTKLIEGETVEYYVNSEKQEGKPQFTDVSSTEVTVKVVAADGTTVWSGEASVTIEKRNVTLTSATDSKQYDGDPLTNGEVTVSEDGFAEGEGATYNVTGSQTVVGSSANTFTYTLNEKTNSANYNITKIEGTLTVTNRDAKYEITVEANSDSAKYDGKEHSVSGIVTNTFKIGNNTYTVEGMDASASGTDAGEYPVNVIGTAVVKDEDGNDVTDQFAVKTNAGTLTIEPREVLITISDAQKVFGTADPQFEVANIEGLIDDSDLGTIIAVRTNNDQTVGIYKDVLDASYIGNSNYSVTVDKGDFMITQQTINPGEDPDNPDPAYNGVTVDTPNDTEYDGIAHQWEPIVSDKDGNALVEGTDYEVSYSTDDFTNVTGIITVTITGKGNYTGEVTRTYQITPRAITLTSGSASKTYDGSALTNSEVTITSGSLVNTIDVTFVATGTITNVGSSLNRISVNYASEQMAKNYVVTLVEGTLTVNTAPVTPTPTPDGGGTTTPTTPTTPGARTTDDGTTTDEPEVEEVEDEETPLSDGDVEDVEDNATPKGNNGIWALINLIAAIVTVILGLILLLSKRHRNDEEEDEEERQARIERGEEKEQEQKRGWICKVLGVIVAIVSVVFFILTEDMSLPMALTDKWTIWMIVIAIVELVLVLVGRHWKDVDDEDQEQQA